MHTQERKNMQGTSDHILELVCNHLNLLLFTNTHSIENLVDHVKKLLRILDGSEPEVDWRICLGEISQSASHGYRMWVLPKEHPL